MNKILTENINRLWSSLIIDELLKNNITHFYISPGMRNAPLIAALVFYQKQDDKIKVFTCMDERGASYRALGYTKATGRPAVLLCTSGTALANYYPAVIEARKSNAPLIIISADRPKEQTLSDDNQTINQNKIYGEFILGELDLGPPCLDIPARALTTSLAHLISRAVTKEKGPVHFNCPFREPLENTPQVIPELYLNSAIAIIESKQPATKYLCTATVLEGKDLEELSLCLRNSKTGILVIGSLPPFIDHSSIQTLINALNWPVYLDVSSSLKYQYNFEQNAIPTFDHPEVAAELIAHPPETIFHIGGRLTSKHYYSLLKAMPTTHLISLNNSADKEDPSHLTQTRINAHIPSVLLELNKTLPKINVKKLPFDFYNFIQNKRQIIDDSPLSYPLISKSIIENLDDYSALYIGNSTAVRSFDSYCSINLEKKFSIITNRGVSGIEGFIASACGYMDGSNKDIYLICGDVSLIHDLNSLYFLSDLKNNLKIILINNFGGGIFTLLPIHKENEVLSIITSPHKEKFKTIALNFKLEYQEVNAVEQLKSALLALKNAKNHALLEIFVDHQQNKLVYDQLKTIKIS